AVVSADRRTSNGPCDLRFLSFAVSTHTLITRLWHQHFGLQHFRSWRPRSAPAGPAAEAAEEAALHPRSLPRQTKLPHQTRLPRQARPLHLAIPNELTPPLPRFPRFNPTRTSS